MISPVRKSVTTGLMLSGGVDSAILLAHLLELGHTVQPFYVSSGCQWEPAERQAVDRFLGELRHARVRPVVDLEMPVLDLYRWHWSVTGQAVPDENTPDEAVYLPGRNPLLLLKPILWCGQHGIPQLAFAALAENPFADASAKFLGMFQSALTTATGKSVDILRPFAANSKLEILDLAAELPLQHTFSCLAPHQGLHCGACNKCAERARAFQALSGGDPTVYACDETAVN